MCSKRDHSELDRMLKMELKNPTSVDDIVNKCRCISIDLNIDQNLIDITLDRNEILSGWKGKMGIYHLWIEEDYCVDHLNHKMLCAYVGKGFVTQRVKSHIKEKWVKDEILSVTFYECPNRIAKYLEQLFLDIYCFHLNKEENHGTKYLKTIWDDFRLVNGTESHDQYKLLEKKNPDFFQQEEMGLAIK